MINAIKEIGNAELTRDKRFILGGLVFLTLALGGAFGCSTQPERTNALNQLTAREIYSATQPLILEGLDYKPLTEQQMRNTNQRKY